LSCSHCTRPRANRRASEFVVGLIARQIPVGRRGAVCCADNWADAMILWRQSMPSLANVAPTATLVFFSRSPWSADAPDLPLRPTIPRRSLARAPWPPATLLRVRLQSGDQRVDFPPPSADWSFLERSTAVASVAGFSRSGPPSVMRRTMGSGTGSAKTTEGMHRYRRASERGPAAVFNPQTPL